LGKFAPGFQEVGKFITDMWKEAESDRELFGFLGTTNTLLGTDDAAGNTLVFISYWSSREALQTFAQGKTHRAGWDWWNKQNKIYPHIAIAHELYISPKGHWENVFVNFQPFGIMQTKTPIKADEKSGGETKFVDNIMECKGSQWNSMQNRLGKHEGMNHF
jgi:heme-degrading monooxygenase HmoA